MSTELRLPKEGSDVEVGFTATHSGDSGVLLVIYTADGGEGPLFLLDWEQVHQVSEYLQGALASERIRAEDMPGLE